MIAADAVLAGDGLHILTFAKEQGVTDKTMRRLLDFISSEFGVALEIDDAYIWRYADQRFRIFQRGLKGK
jgi:hypothetical protein